MKTKLIYLLLSVIYMLLILAVIAIPDFSYEKVSYNVFNISHAIYLFIIFLILIIYTLIAQKKNWIYIHKKSNRIINYIFLGLASTLMTIDFVESFIAMIVAKKAIIGLLNFLVCFILLEILCFTLISIIHIRKPSTCSKIPIKTGTKCIGLCFTLALLYALCLYALPHTEIERILIILYYIKLPVIYFIWFVYNVYIERKKLDLIYRKENVIANIVFVCLTTILSIVDSVFDIIGLRIAIVDHRSFATTISFLLIILLLTLMILSIMNTIKIARKSKEVTKKEAIESRF